MEESASNANERGLEDKEMRTYRNLYEEFVSEDNIRLAIINASKGKRNRTIMKDMYSDPDRWIPIIQRWVICYKNPMHHPVEIYDGISRKKRVIICPTNKEQVIHHMLCNVLKPVFMKSMYEHSYGSVPDRGGVAGKKAIEKWMKTDRKNCRYVLKMDIHKFFDSIPHEILKAKLSRIITDDCFKEILFEVINETEKGLPLGFYTSQWLANWYLQDLDHYIKEELRAVHYIRYMDDMVIFGSNKRKLHKMKDEIESYLLNELGLEMNPKWQVYRFDHIKDGKHYGRDLDFMGFRFFCDRTIMRKSIMLKCTRKAKRISKKDRVNIRDARQMVSYLGWLDHTDTYNMYLERVKPYVNYKKLKKRISADDKRKAKERKVLYELEKGRVSGTTNGAGHCIITGV